MNLCMHTCCAPCAVACVDALQAEGIAPTLFWYNPNIHPLMEYRQRKDALRDYANQINIAWIVEEEYGLRRFIEGVYPDFDRRCEYCYRERLGHTARYAAENGYDAFTTTLLISPYQDHTRICNIAREMGEKYQVDFLYRDFRPLFREGQNKARAEQMYMQKYCGCIFSEEDRYTKKK